MNLKEFITNTILIFLLTAVVFPRPLCYQEESCHFETSKTLSETAKVTGEFLKDLMGFDTTPQAKHRIPKKTQSTNPLIAFFGFIFLFFSLLKLTLLKPEYQTNKNISIYTILTALGTIPFIYLALYNWNTFPSLFFHSVSDFLFIIMISITTALVYESLKNNWTLYSILDKVSSKNTEQFYTILTAWVITIIIYTGIYYYYSLMNPICGIECIGKIYASSAS
ncbi:MAG: hypothetical protein DRN71_05665 [Candidatus Nanohalarchaeota archaeon]|nr:MAG: hypothetical protein DRN71_05665 [Candidatus Nanohaloarchaeota archaeon]